MANIRGALLGAEGAEAAKPMRERRFAFYLNAASAGKSWDAQYATDAF